MYDTICSIRVPGILLDGVKNTLSYLECYTYIPAHAPTLVQVIAQRWCNKRTGKALLRRERQAIFWIEMHLRNGLRRIHDSFIYILLYNARSN